MGLRQLPSNVFSLFDEYPVMRRYRNRRIAPTILLISILLLIGLVIFNVLTQGQSLRYKPFLSSQFFNGTMFPNGDNVTCQPAPMKLSESFFTVVPAKDAPRVSVSTQGYQWTIYAVIPPGGPTSGNTTTGFLYSGEKLNCTSVYAHHTYTYETGNFKFNSCASCLLSTNFTIKICTMYDSATPKLPKFARLFYNNQPDLGFQTLDRIYRSMSIPPHSLPRSAFPPGYNEEQPDLNTSIEWRQVTQLRSWLGNISLIPPPADGSSKEKIVIHNSTVVDTFFEAFKATDGVEESSGFETDVKDIGVVKPLGQVYNLTGMPKAWAEVFNESLSMNRGLMGAANRDLGGINDKQIGVNYLCTNTTKEWQTVPNLVSVTVGSTLAVFSACFTLLVAMARKLDNFQRKDVEMHQLTSSPTQSTLKLHDVEVVRLST
ncbi:hypothetical protein PTTG_28755 [Puccinia triticina 1-1 BBBD Race 1]|uniref:Uncharacterized protein n=2 Tax=Puccinia triticina TaxID=208348 RepID=A0A180G9E4_PUCT1|nr:uncharacterized protein PtA15_11A541 [Puccinia triticina]OAV89244.1 hypothetical protein PTTG_28755 [Puccinia triticina 1-1 BBBD Race 1]WAQ89849.1 hypothetical protein PtA15_11A541 [Puccinia triticina]WAR59897.1 hypothetical protein PtB15_11B538 [Puccinia triticina]